ncbi:hypothetical protein FN846DRAFT_1019226 [Sphaerosporella brunnea]|uniref:Uncharacterized protein n=1 Tax=Sphaerosporella brunnea TaxID=1250544 RepID=A0A5J5F6Q2_9PEZI|nr:hypothetical protein FN846DRAFT_1019226 [Sphaerosporella brunnea]
MHAGPPTHGNAGRSWHSGSHGEAKLAENGFLVSMLAVEQLLCCRCRGTIRHRYKPRVHDPSAGCILRVPPPSSPSYHSQPSTHILTYPQKTMPSHADVQAALNSYSVAVQQYKVLAERLPPPARPPVLERFQHRCNKWAIQRRTADVRKTIARMERQLEGLQLQQANDDGNQRVVPQRSPSATREQVEGIIDPHTRIVDRQDSANAFRQESDACGRQHRAATAVPRNGDARDTVATQRPPSTDSNETAHSVWRNNNSDKQFTAGIASGTSADDAAARVVAHGLTESDRTDDIPRDGSSVPAPDSIEDALSAADEIHAIVRVGVASPAMAMHMTRLVEALKADGAGAAVVKRVYTVFWDCVDSGATVADMNWVGGDGN